MPTSTTQQQQQQLLFAERVAKTALDHYANVLPPTKGKPKENEWTVYAALVASEEEKEEEEEDNQAAAYSSSTKKKKKKLWVVASATGTKCTTERCQGCILHDSHAEVLVRRGFVRCLWTEIIRNIRTTAMTRNKQKVHVDDLLFLSSSKSKDYYCSSTELLLEPIKNAVGSIKSESTTATTTSTTTSTCSQFCIRRGVKLHLYVSDSPCGDASIYDIAATTTPTCTEDHNSNNNNSNNQKNEKAAQMQFTGAKVIVSSETNVSLEACGNSVISHSHHHHHPPPKRPNPIMTVDGGGKNHQLAREETQLLGKLRSKSGRSNLETSRRSSSMSCSDKLLRWGVLGLQGRLLATFLPEPIRLESIVVSRDPRVGHSHNDHHELSQMIALKRAISDRIFAVEKSIQQRGVKSPVFLSDIRIPDLFVCDAVFERGKSVVEASQSNIPTDDSSLRKRKRRESSQEAHSNKKAPPTGISVHWQQTDPTVELIIGARGIRQGKKPKTSQDYPQLQSRLSRAAMVQLARESGVFQKSNNDLNHPAKTYQLCKQECSLDGWEAARKLIFASGPLAGWMVSDASNDWKME